MSRRHAGGGGVAPPLLAAAVGLALLAVVPRPTVADAPAAPQRPADPGEVDDVLDLLYLAPARPYLFRLHVSIDGKPYTARWAERVLKVFQYLDKANDGVLTKEEVAPGSVAAADGPAVPRHALRIGVLQRSVACSRRWTSTRTAR